MDAIVNCFFCHLLVHLQRRRDFNGCLSFFGASLMHTFVGLIPSLRQGPHGRHKHHSFSPRMRRVVHVLVMFEPRRL